MIIQAVCGEGKKGVVAIDDFAVLNVKYDIVEWIEYLKFMQVLLRFSEVM